MALDLDLAPMSGPRSPTPVGSLGTGPGKTPTEMPRTSSFLKVRYFWLTVYLFHFFFSAFQEKPPKVTVSSWAKRKLRGPFLGTVLGAPERTQLRDDYFCSQSDYRLFSAGRISGKTVCSKYFYLNPRSSFLTLKDFPWHS